MFKKAFVLLVTSVAFSAVSSAQQGVNPDPKMVGVETLEHTVLEGYFVKNTIPNSKTEVEGMVITSQTGFDNYFGMATTMTTKPTSVNFKTHNVIALIGKESSSPSTFVQENLSQVVGPNAPIRLEVAYNIGAKSTYTSRAVYLVAVPKKLKLTTTWAKALAVVKIGKKEPKSIALKLIK